MYKLPISYQTENGLIQPECIQRLSDLIWIPFDPANTDYQEFLKYKEAGGKVYEADEEVPSNG